ncbi:hypothetical protein KR222_004181 [Zaprionus bogoriensis]|nr:hypothetical protein KR222_004181 [Zaprionus bogoriensis]
MEKSINFEDIAFGQVSSNIFLFIYIFVYSDVLCPQLIDRGSYGEVYRAVYNGRNVAVKKIYRPAFEEELPAIRREYKQLSRANHINIVFLHGITIQQDIHYLMMEYIDGGTLSKLLHVSTQPYTLTHGLNWGLQVARAVAYLHSRDIIHRDVKPLNMLLAEERTCVKLCDFGFVREMATTMTGNRGTAPYMAPEVFNGQKYTEKCDVFSWGITMWEILSRRIPYSDVMNLIKICTAVEKGERPSINDLQWPCGDEIKELLIASWHHDSRKRPEMAAIVELLEPYAVGKEQLRL